MIVSEEKVEELTKRIGKNEKNPFLYLMRGVAYDDLNEYEKAVQDYSEAIELNPQDSVASVVFNNRGGSYNNLKEYEKAVQDFSKAIELNPQLSEAYYNRGSTFYNLKDFEKAIQDYSKAIELNPQNYVIYNNRGLAYRNFKEYEKAVQDYSKAIELNPQYYVAHSNRGFAYYNLKDYGKAVQDYSKAIELNPQDSVAYNNRGLSYRNFKEYEKAVQDYSKAIELNPQDYVSFYSRGLVFQIIDENDKALSDFSQSIVLEPKEARNYFLRGVVYKTIGEHEKSSQDFETARKLNPDIERMIKAKTSTLARSLDYICLETVQLQKELKKKKFEDLNILQKLGGGAFGRTYLCNVKGLEGEFVVKIYKSDYEEEKQKEMVQKDAVFVQFHPNIVTVLCHSENETIDTKELPDYENDWEGFSSNDILENTPMVLMKYFPEDLARYVNRNDNQLKSLQVCKILQGIVCGANFLHERMIVHRDLHSQNILIDEEFDRVSICDFGCALDLRGNHLEFKVKKSEEILYILYSCGSMYWEIGNKIYLPPEILQAVDDDDCEFLDYTKSDLYSIGMIGKYLLENCVDDEEFEEVKKIVDRFSEKEIKDRVDFPTAVTVVRRVLLENYFSPPEKRSRKAQESKKI